MASTIILYDHTARRFAGDGNTEVDGYRLMLCSAATFNGADATLASITKTEIPEEHGYLAGGEYLQNVVVSTINGNDAKFDADDVQWTPTGGAIAAAYAILYNSTQTDNPPVAFIDFGGTRSEGVGSVFRVIWHTDGIVTFTVA